MNCLAKHDRTLATPLCFGFILLLTCVTTAIAEDSRTTTIGMPRRIVDLILPGTQLEVIPIRRDAPVVVRILQAIGHGPDKHRYELEYYCLEAGDFDLSQYLRRSDGTTTKDLPEISVTVKDLLGPGQVRPNELATQATPRIGGYKKWLIVGGIVWLGGLFALLLGGRRRLTSTAPFAKQLSLADRLQPLVEEAMRGELSRANQAELERMLLTYWRGKLGLNDTVASEAIVKLREHQHAGELLRQLEAWLHMPANRRPTIDLAELLRPYRNVHETAAPALDSGVNA